MSQEKVDKYKKEKANRKKIIAKQKRIAFLEKSVFALVVIAFVAFIGGSVYFKWFDKKKDTVAEAATYSLSEEEISSVWAAHENPEEETTSPIEDSTTAATEEETTAASEDSAEDDNDNDSDNDNDNDNDSDSSEDNE